MRISFDPTLFHTFFDDFDRYVAGDWVITETGTGSRALADVDGGALLITNAAADNDANFFQLAKESFKFEVGKSMYFEARFKVSDATQSDFIMGLAIRDTTPLAVSDGIMFRKDDGDASLDFQAIKNGTATDKLAIATVANDTFIKVAFYYDGSRSQIEVLVNDESVSYVPLTNVVDDEELTITFGIQNGEAVAKTMTVDYIVAMKARD